MSSYVEKSDATAARSRDGAGLADDVARRLARRRRRRLRTERVVSIVSPIGLLGLWELLSRVGILDTRFFSRPSLILLAGWKMSGNSQLAEAFGISLSRALVGFVLGAIPALVVGLLMGQSRLVRAAINPLIAALYPIPKIAVLPLVILVFGLGETSKYVVIAVGSFSSWRSTPCRGR